MRGRAKLAVEAPHIDPSPSVTLQPAPASLGRSPVRLVPTSSSEIVPNATKLTTPIACVTIANAAACARGAPSDGNSQVTAAWYTPTDEGADGMAIANSTVATS